MRKLLDILRNIFSPANTDRQQRERYLAESVSLADLERRLKELEKRYPYL